MKEEEKILQLNSNLSRMMDSLCFELSVNRPDTNSLSLIQILEWRNSNQISQEELKELYCGWLQSKNIYDLFTAKQVETYPKHQLLQLQDPLKKILSVNEITKTLQILNNLYNQIYIQKRVKGLPSLNVKNEVKNIEQVEKLFSFLDSSGVINLGLSQLFFLYGSLVIAQNQYIPLDFQQFQPSFKQFLQEISSLNGSLSLRSFKNYFLVDQKKPSLLKNLSIILSQIKNFANLTAEIKPKETNSMPNIFKQSLEKWKSYPIFKNQEKKIQCLRRIFEQNESVLLFGCQNQPETIDSEFSRKYGNQLLACLQVDQYALEQFTQILQDTLNKYLNIFQKISSVVNKNRLNQPKYIGQSAHKTLNSQTAQKKLYDPININTSGKKKGSPLELQASSKQMSKTAFKERTPQKAKSNNYDLNNYRNKTPTNKNSSDVYAIRRQFGSAQKRQFPSNYNGSGRQTTPTKSTLSFLTEAPRTYRASQKRGLTQNNFYDKLFFFRNKRVESYQIVMKRLKNK